MLLSLPGKTGFSEEMGGRAGRLPGPQLQPSLVLRGRRARGSPQERGASSKDVLKKKKKNLKKEILGKGEAKRRLPGLRMEELKGERYGLRSERLQEAGR